jgi:predicted GIY-YIG superfamily endonuclease
LTLRRTYGVYVVEIDDDPDYVYVGYSAHTPEHRLEQHQTGEFEIHHAAQVFRSGSRATKLRPDLYRHLNRFELREEAIEEEVKLAAQLRKQGYVVVQG